MLGNGWGVSVGRSLATIAGWVGLATAVSKGMGLVRQLLIAAYFGSGVELSAYAVAYVLPGFLLILLGGINGPFHSAIVSVLRKRQDEEQGQILQSISTLVGCVLGGIVVLLWWGADLIVRWTAPGSSPEVHVLAAQQLRIMAPLALFAGWIGIGFGALNAAEHYTLPALSPLLSSGTLVAGLVLFGSRWGVTLLSVGTLLGGMGQWLVQLPLQVKLGLGRLGWSWNWGSPAVRAMASLLVPAVISAGMVHINVYVDLFFASFIPGDRTIANLGYAQLLIQTPLGLLSNMILVPLMPVFASLATPEKLGQLRGVVQSAVEITVGLTLPLTMICVVLAEPLVRLIYERGAFSSTVSGEVAALLVGYGTGMSFYLVRDVLVRVFYALEDGRTPLLVSGLAIGSNALLDWVGVQTVGAVGIPLATAGVNIVSVLVLTGKLMQRWQHPGDPQIGVNLVKMVGLTFLAGGVAAWIAAPGLGANGWVCAAWTGLAILISGGLYLGVGMRLGIPGCVWLGQRFKRESLKLKA